MEIVCFERRQEAFLLPCTETGGDQVANVPELVEEMKAFKHTVHRVEVTYHSFHIFSLPRACYLKEFLFFLIFAPGDKIQNCLIHYVEAV